MLPIIIFNRNTIRRSAPIWGAVLIVLTAASCLSERVVTYQSDFSPQNAEFEFEERRKATEVLRKRIRAIKDVIRPINSLLAEIENIIDLQIDGHRANNVGAFTRILHDLLEQAETGAVQRVNNRWYYSELINSDFLETLTNSSILYIDIQGYRQSGKDHMDISLTSVPHWEEDFGMEPPFSIYPISKFIIDRDGEIIFDFYPENLDRLVRKDVEYTFGSTVCSIDLQFNKNKPSTFSCNSPFEYVMSEYTVHLEINKIEVSRNLRHLSADIKLLILDSWGNEQAFVEIKPSKIGGRFEKPRINLVIEGEEDWEDYDFDYDEDGWLEDDWDEDDWDEGP